MYFITKFEINILYLCLYTYDKSISQKRDSIYTESFNKFD